jgi:hypothetical protein
MHTTGVHSTGLVLFCVPIAFKTKRVRVVHVLFGFSILLLGGWSAETFKKFA